MDRERLMRKPYCACVMFILTSDIFATIWPVEDQFTFRKKWNESTDLRSRSLIRFRSFSRLGRDDVHFDVDVVQDLQRRGLSLRMEGRSKSNRSQSRLDLRDRIPLDLVESIRQTDLSQIRHNLVVEIRFAREDENRRSNENVVMHLGDLRLHLRRPLSCRLSCRVVESLHSSEFGEEAEESVDRFFDEGEAERSGAEEDESVVTGVRGVVVRVVRLVAEVDEFVSLNRQHFSRLVGGEVVHEGEIAKSSGDSHRRRPQHDRDVGGGERKRTESESILVEDDDDTRQFDLDSELVVGLLDGGDRIGVEDFLNGDFFTGSIRERRHYPVEEGELQRTSQ